MKKKFLVPLLALVPAAGLAVAGPAAAATPQLMITRIQFDSPGKDTRSNASLNQEYIRVTNTTTKGLALKGWTIRDKANHVYTLKAQTLGAKQSVYVHTGKGTDGKPNSPDRFWQSGNYVWNNDGDTAIVRDPAGRTIDTCVYTARQAPATGC